jgi:hypothetical protein
MMRFFERTVPSPSLSGINDVFEVLWLGSYMNLNHPEMLESGVFRSYVRNRTFPSKFLDKEKQINFLKQRKFTCNVANLISRAWKVILCQQYS